ncbi:WD40 repeat-like protein [Pseudovirgaria hyperparasitica]|uniref:WD40 repeat-like protein n=1 Tax=Pseudovirgaria hyperparasitica TaxID=470096 RepID=A0A6A6W2V4_9PEZI|nr:WD40 repeat-like protein [Pseudovirgaria hyperparasitica]KAF2756344.1 WD40 repeat-like protein [Pseudovirgaria hyperparasitica]
MTSVVFDRLLNRELGYSTGSKNRYSHVRGLYGDQKWVHDLDIVNELDGHQGCVNALSWSRSGRLLASGSDDQHVNIHTYLPDSSTSQFQFTTTIATGHHANIFSVKFMPHSNDRTIVSAAGDSEIRVFDIEYSGQTTSSDSASNFRSRAGANNIYNGVRYLSEGDSNAKVFRSHGDRVKRIVTESSPFFFLTCSEDGEVRQWDVRQPSSAYPAPSRRSSLSSRNAPPPLISYKKYGLDLNTISCSPSQPHYIALGGAHLHCFLHDRRMLGRDRAAERGDLLRNDLTSQHEEDALSEATRCVKKFAPHGKRTMRRSDSGHITACKISDSNPNELIVSWSGDHIYNFDINRTPDASEAIQYTTVEKGNSNRAKTYNDRKRKRTGLSQSAISNEGAARADSRPRTDSAEPAEQEMSLMVQYENGQSEEIPIESRRPQIASGEASLGESEKLSYRISKSTIDLRKQMFTLGQPKSSSAVDVTGHAAEFTSIIGLSASILPEMDDIMKSWRYPVDPSELEVVFQNRLRDDRGSARRFVQAAGITARILGGRLRMGGASDAMIDQYFTTITPVPNERTIPRHQQFGFDFMKAIYLWLDSGIGALAEGFCANKGRRGSTRFPIPDDEAAEEAIHEILIPYLLDLASDNSVLDVDASRFEVDENRITFTTEKAAVMAFARAIRIPFADLSSSADGPASVQDRRTALRFWAFKVGRGLLMNAAQGINFELVDRAFGGMGRGEAGIIAAEAAFAERFKRREGEEEEEDPRVHQATLRTRDRPRTEADSTSDAAPLGVDLSDSVQDDQSEDEDEQNSAVGHSEDDESMSGNDAASSSEDEEEEDDDDDDDVDEQDELANRIFWRSNFSRRVRKEKVEASVPCGTHTRIYKGHCNVKTVKDVNFYGLEDEYVVSGSDSGHLFIWDRKTSKLLNILEGDGEVVNVVQGHPYEPMIAVSGIDHTIKIFSPDARSRSDARNGIGVKAADSSDFSSINFSRRRRRDGRARASSSQRQDDDAAEEEGDIDSDDESRIAHGGLPSRKRIQDEYQITSENDRARDGGGGSDAFLTQSMLLQIARHLRQQQAEGNTNVDLPMMLAGGDGEDCHVSHPPSIIPLTQF